MKYLLVVVLFWSCKVNGFTGDDRFIRKYAMMKVYESCFGSEVVKEVRKEMKAASAKCIGVGGGGGSVGGHPLTQFENGSPPVAPPGGPSHSKSPASNKLSSHHHKIHLQIDQNASGDESGGLHSTHHQVAEVPHYHPDSALHSNAIHQASAPSVSALHSHSDHQKQPAIDFHKLQQAIMSGYNKHVSQQNTAFEAGLMQSQPSQYRPQFYHQQQHPQMGYSNPSYYQPQPYYQQQQQPYYQQPYYNPAPYQPYQPAPYQQPYQQPYYPTQRSSRDLDVRGQLETLTSQMAGKVRNVTCVMQELGYLDMNLEPDYGRMLDRIKRLPVAEQLKRDMAEGVDFCRKFSECVPEDNKDKLVRELVRPMFFFKCYKHKKLEACIMKDVRERYMLSEEEMTEDNVNEARSGKGLPDDKMATALYEFLYGGDSLNDVVTLF